MRLGCHQKIAQILNRHCLATAAAVDYDGGYVVLRHALANVSKSSLVFRIAEARKRHIGSECHVILGSNCYSAAARSVRVDPVRLHAVLLEPEHETRPDQIFVLKVFLPEELSQLA
jgi:hypothetical protein